MNKQPYRSDNRSRFGQLPVEPFSRNQEIRGLAGQFRSESEPGADFRVVQTDTARTDEVRGLTGQVPSSEPGPYPVLNRREPGRTAYLQPFSVPDSIGTAGCRRFRNRLFDKHPAARELLVKSYIRIAQEKTYVEANLNLLGLDDRLSRGELKLSMQDEELREFCQNKAWLCQRIHAKRDNDSAERRIREIVSRNGIEFPDCDQLPALERCKDQKWWRRQVRGLQKREFEQISRDMRLVHKSGDIYASNTNVRMRRSQKARNRLLLSELKATNQFGDEFNLKELSDVSVSNPEIRRSELMVRLRGFEENAKSRNLKADFYTITCPSRFHSAHQNGHAVDSYGNHSAREANEYLQKVWARIRAKLGRDGIRVFGFRVAEPHHDGCPHWHLILFMEPKNINRCRRVVRHYALEDSPNEPGAQAHRVKVIPIDPSKGSATGYVAKYISKNINGAGLDSDQFGNCPIETAERIETWASVNGIRQFQQIGGPSVSVWRELRRLQPGEPGLIEDARRAADSSDWALFVELMGGPFCGRNQPIELAKRQNMDSETGEVLATPFNKYGEPCPDKIFGVRCGAVTAVTRIYKWVIEWVNSPGYFFRKLGSQPTTLEYCQ